MVLIKEYKMAEVKTNLRWAGGKSKMIKILDNFFPKEVNKYIETFTGGGSVLLHIMQKYQPEVAYANDIDGMLINYYNCIKSEPDKVINECLEIKNSYDCKTFTDRFYELNRNIASHFFTANKTSFSGLNKNYSYQAYDRNFSVKCINKIKDISNVLQNVNFVNGDFVKLDEVVGNIDGYFIYLDPPYYGNKDKGLYGENGKLHKEFNHIELFEWVEKHKDNNQIMLSYDDSPYIRELYKDYNIYSFDFVYSMTNTGGNLCKNGKEIVITNYSIGEYE
jgi:DNA adenine methylase